MESTDWSAGSPQPNLPPGFRFHPTDEELVVYYLKKKAANLPLPVSIIAEIDLYKFDPWELPAKATFGEQEWYFFSPRERKYPNGARPNRAATTGYWKATGTDKPIIAAGGNQKVGVKKALVFYGGKPPKGVKTNWIMHEYRLVDNNKTTSKPPSFDPTHNKKASLRLDDWVLCRIYKKNNPPRSIEHERDMDTISMGNMLTRIPPSSSSSSIPVSQQNQKLQALMLENDHNLFEEMIIGNNAGININGTGYNISQLGATSNSNPQIPLRALPSLFWNGDNASPEATAKRFRGESNDDEGGCIAKTDENTSIATLLSNLNHLPQNPVLHQQTMMMGSLGDGVFRPWYS